MSAVGLADLPTETLLLILQFLSGIDLQTLLLAQRVSRKFREVIHDVISYEGRRLTNCYNGAYEIFSSSKDENSSGGDGCRQKAVINPFLQKRFKGLFSSADCFTKDERARYWVLTLDGDYTLPFRRLPWVSDPAPDMDPGIITTSTINESKNMRDSRAAAFLRPDASWRTLSPTFGSSSPFSSCESPRSSNIIRRLDVVKDFDTETGCPVSYSQVALPPSGLTMEMLYDVLLCEEATYGRETGSWELLVGKALKSFDVLYRWGCFIIDEPGESSLVAEVLDAAILYVRGGEGCSGGITRHHDNVAATGLDGDKKVWTPRKIGAERPEFLPWQGPLIDPEETEWFL
jgi:hypothetical protein